MEKVTTPMDLYQREVEKPKPQTKKEVEARFNELLNAKDDDFLKGEVHASDSLSAKNEKDSDSTKSTNKDTSHRQLFQTGDKVHLVSNEKTIMMVVKYDADGKVICRIESAYNENELVKCE